MTPPDPAQPRQHDSPADAGDHPLVSSRNARYGLWLFAVYLVVYGGFVGLAAFAPRIMALTPLAGVNLVVVYGLGLIGIAVLLALVYVYLCRERGGPAA